MSTELRSYHQAQQLWVRAYSSAWRRHRMQDPSLWMQQEPEIIEKMQRDADIAHALNFRGHLIAGQEWSLTPKSKSSKNGELAVEVGTELLGEIEYFTEALLLLASAFLSGARIGRIHGEPRKLRLGDGKLRTWWVPTRIEDLDKRMLQKISEIDPQTQEIKAHWEQWHTGRAQWETLTRAEARDLIRHTYQDNQGSLGYGRGLREAMAWWWYTKEHVLEESVQACERFAQGMMIAKVDGSQAAAQEKTNAQLFADYAEMLENQRARHVLVIDTKDDVEMMKLSGEGWELLKWLTELLNTTISTLILGSNLPTTANSGGSYALADVQENSREALIQFDRKTLEESVTKGAVNCLWSRNWPNLVELGIAETKLKFGITQEKIEDSKEIAEVASVLHNMGVPLSAQDLYERTGMKKPEKDEEVIEGATPPPDPFGGGNGFGLPGLPGQQPPPRPATEVPTGAP